MTAPKADTGTPWVLTRREQQPDWTFPPRADTVGFIRAKCNGMKGKAFNAGLILIPAGQTTPVHSNSGEHIIYQLEGEVEFEIGGERYPLAPHDMLFIPANDPYSYTNTGRDTASFISIIGELDTWPPKATYFDERPATRTAATTAGTTGPAWILTRREQQPVWTLPRADTVGFIRGWYTRMEATGFHAGIVSMAPGQTTPLHSSAAEHIMYLLDGEVEFTIEGRACSLLPGDMLFIPADAKYVYTNVGRTQGTFLSIISKVDAWPHEDTYYE